MSVVEPQATRTPGAARTAQAFEDWMRAELQVVEARLEAWVPAETPAGLGEAMRYGVLDGGKRLRPLLVLAASEATHGVREAALRAAVSVELIHAYSLIHDDMPCMDNDVLRRGKPTVHVRYGQAQAMLAGDAMQALAFEVLTPQPGEGGVEPALQARLCGLLARSAGHAGMAGGQAIDLASVGRPLDEATLRDMHRRKTGALLQASVVMGAACGEPPATVAVALAEYGSALGLAFQVVDDILDVSRIMSGKMELAVGPVQVIVPVEAAIESIRPAAMAKGIRIQPLLDTRAVVTGDPQRLQQVIWNLLSNAVKFTPNNGRVQITVEQREASVSLVVSDNGQGLSPQFLPYVFDRFRQADPGSTRLHGGLGLGLSIVKHLVELHGGTVKAESEGLGRGARFTVMLPTALSRMSPAAAPAPSIECPPEVAGLRILIIEDEKDTRELLREILIGFGLVVEAVRQRERIDDGAGRAVEQIEAVGAAHEHVGDAVPVEVEPFDVDPLDVASPPPEPLPLPSTNVTFPPHAAAIPAAAPTPKSQARFLIARS